MDIHIKEDTAKPENRTNLAFFSILMIPEVREFVLQRLNIPSHMVIHPAPDLRTQEFDILGRPDFQVITPNKDTFGFIEVELGPEDQKQISSYALTGKKIYSIVGKTSYKQGENGKGDLSLEEIDDFIKTIEEKYKDSQQGESMALFSALVLLYVRERNFTTSNKRSALSKKMASSPLIQEIKRYFGKDNVRTNGKVQRGRLLIDTIKENGFSVRVYSTETPKGLSLMSRSGGHENIEFPSLSKLKKYFPYKQDAALAFASVISDLGACEIKDQPEAKRVKLHINVVEQNLAKIVLAIESLI